MLDTIDQRRLFATEKLSIYFTIIAAIIGFGIQEASDKLATVVLVYSVIFSLMQLALLTLRLCSRQTYVPIDIEDPTQYCFGECGDRVNRCQGIELTFGSIVSLVCSIGNIVSCCEKLITDDAQ